MARPAPRRSKAAPKRARPDEPTRSPAPPSSDDAASGAPPASSVGRGSAALAVLAFVASVAIAGTGNRDVLRAVTGGLAFLAGAAGAFDPRRAPVVFAFIGIVGLALVGIGPGTSGQTLTLDVGIGLAMGGVLGLGGAIHRLGRLGPA